jgi:peptide/nickel transport system permease protein
VPSPAYRTWRRFARNPLSVFGLVLMTALVGWALLAPWATPYPRHAGAVVDVARSGQPPSRAHVLGTDPVGRDILTRVAYAYRLSLLLGVAVLSVATPVGVVVGLLAGYLGRWRETVLMRATDVFLSIPPLVLALAILGFLQPNLVNAMVAVSAMWWPWYARLTYNVTRQVATEGYVTAAEVVGASTFHVVFREILPNCAAPIVTKMTLDLGFVILLGSSLSFLGLGVQPPTPDLGSMVAEGAKYLPDLWWLAVFPGLAILIAVLGFNLMGDGVSDVLDVER